VKKLVFVLTLLATVPIFAEIRNASETLATFGVDAFDSSNYATLGTVALYRDGNLVGTFGSRSNGDGVTTATLNIDSRSLTISWRRNPIRWWGTLDGVGFASSFDEHTRQLIDAPGTRSLAEKNQGMFALLSTIFDEVPQSRRKAETMGDTPDPGFSTGILGDIANLDPFGMGCLYCGGGGTIGSCSGPMVDGEAFLNISKSVLCDMARQQANNNCNNGYCFGCCKLLDCDAICFVGDFVCVAAHVAGQSCSPADRWP
jgi:hypothetical protein